MIRYAFTPPLPARLLEQEHFFELYPFDGGGGFIHHSIFGSFDDGKIERAVNDGALKPFGTFPAIDFARFEDWSSIEKSCWINRMYFTVPLARRAFLTGNRMLGKAVLESVLHFARTMPEPENPEAAWRETCRARDEDYNRRGVTSGAVSYSWFDFQPASRVINLTHAMWFLDRLGILTEDDVSAFMKLLAAHAETLFPADDQWEKPTPRDNHQALRALALLYCATLFPDEKRYLETARERMLFHIENDYFPDGMLAEISPSYHAFMTWIARDGIILCERLGAPLPPRAVETLFRAAAACEALTLPDGKAAVINDGYPLNSTVFRKTLPPTGTCGKFFRFPDAQLAGYRSDGNYLLLDASPETGELSHYHAGKNAITLWHDGKPFLADGGCVNYDTPEFTLLKQAEIHSSLLIDGVGDAELSGRYFWRSFAETNLGEWENSRISATGRSPRTQWEGKLWKRTVRVTERGMELLDEISSPCPCRATLLFALHPDVAVRRTPAGFQLQNGNETLEMEFDPAAPEHWSVEPSVSAPDFVPQKSLRLRAEFTGKTIRCFTRWIGGK